MSVIMEETSRGWGAPTGYRKLTEEDKKEARESSLRFQKQYGFVRTK